jgi:hypothetical protein
MGVITIQEKFDGWFADQLAADGLNPVQGSECAEALKWASRGWNGAVKEIQEEGLRNELERKMRELATMAKTFPREFQEVADRIERDLS